MHIIHIDCLTVNHAGREIFRELSWAIGDRDKIGLVGPSGVGKSTLLKAILGEVTPESGSITIQRGVRIGYLPQIVALTPGRTLLAEALSLPPELACLEEALNKVEAQLGDPAVYNDESALSKALDRQARLLAEFDAAGGARHESEVRSLLVHLGFTEADYDLSAETLSGGQKKLVLLARLAAARPEVLLLDEPDNHLDIAAKRRLERFINGYGGAVVIVSHDRYLLDEVAGQIAELDGGKLTLWPGNYTAYANARELARLRQQQMYTAQQKEIQRIEAAIARFEQWASIVVDERHIRQARSRRKMLDRMEANGEIVERVTERRAMDLQLNGWRGSTKALEIKDLAMAFGDDLLFTDVDLLVRHGERVGLVGPNGIGKSVLFHLVRGELTPLEGTVRVGPSTQIGYYAQEHQTLAGWLDRTPLERVWDIRPMSEGAAVTFLLKFQFQYEQLRLPVRAMSGGERSRLQLAALMLEQPNLLLLDEPTNNLDIQAVEALEAALEDFEGALLVISHDRYFLDRVVDRVVELAPEGLTSFAGGYTDYLQAAGRDFQAGVG